MRPLPAVFRKPDPSFFPGKSGQGRWAERIYFHVLNCGLMIPPSAGSGSGVTPNPPGQNRVYVHCDPSAPLDYDTWWTNLRAGRVFVTNGPLLRTSVRGHPPGHMMQLEADEKLQLQVGANLATRDRIEYLELIKNGEVEAQVQLDDWAKSGGRLPPVSFSESGWLAVRAARTFRRPLARAAWQPIPQSCPRIIPLVGTPTPAVTSTWSFFAGWFSDVPRISRTPSFTPFIPWMYASLS